MRPVTCIATAPDGFRALFPFTITVESELQTRLMGIRVAMRKINGDTRLLQRGAPHMWTYETMYP